MRLFATVLIAASLLVVCSQKVGHPYFYLEEGSTKCFAEDVPQDTPITVRYESYDNPGVACSVVYRDPSGRTVMSREVTHEQPTGRVSYLAASSGQHQICVICRATQWLSTSQLKWSISIEIGEAEAYPLMDAAKSHQLEELQAILTLVKSKSALLTAENDYERRQEAAFRNTSEAMNTRVVIFAIIEIALIIGVTAFSVFHLSNYFHTQKLY